MVNTLEFAFQGTINIASLAVLILIYKRLSEEKL